MGREEISQKRTCVVFLLVFMLALTACQGGIDRDAAQMLVDSLDDLSVTVWGGYDFTAHYRRFPGDSIDIPVTVIDEKGFKALAADPPDRKFAMLVVSGEIIGDDLLTPERVDQLNGLLDRGVVIFFMTDSETAANRIAMAVTGSDWEYSAGDSKARLHAFSIFRVGQDDPRIMGAEPGDPIMGGIHAIDSITSISQSSLDALMLRRTVDRYH